MGRRELRDIWYKAGVGRGAVCGLVPGEGSEGGGGCGGRWPKGEGEEVVEEEERGEVSRRYNELFCITVVARIRRVRVRNWTIPPWCWMQGSRLHAAGSKGRAWQAHQS